ncbi:MAG: putative bifunctional diguanylate cyclase/phosphodiesterase [Bryobacteraceae bacterium]
MKISDASNQQSDGANGDSISKLAFRESERLTGPLLTAALDDPHTGLLILDAELRLLHATSRIRSLLGVNAKERLADLDLDSLLARSALDSTSVAAVKEHLARRSSENPSAVTLHSATQVQSIRMRVRGIDNDCHVLSFDPESEKPGDFAAKDPLTGLASRHAFEAAVSEALDSNPGIPVAVILINLDRFKAVNDALSLAAGDTLLRLASERLKASTRKEDVVARLSGDEFAVLIHPSHTLDEPKTIASRILDLVQRTYLIDGQLVNIGTSMGIAHSSTDGEDCATLLRSADLALYHAKASGRGNYQIFDAQMERKAQARRTGELELRRALALRQFEVHYQPQVNTRSDRLVGFEALVRWRHPERGLIPPGLFLPLAEEIGLIVPIGEWVLRTACREATRWPNNITIAVNASPLQFDVGNYANIVRKALTASGLPGERLEIEVTEGILLRNDEVILKTLHELRDMKVRLAMDDFGTGYASLSQLARFPFDKIKIDRSLAGFEGENMKQRAIVRAITALGASLGVCTLAEGVENAAQISRLREDGCHSVQGYYYGKPMPASDAEQLILHMRGNRASNQL